MPTNSARSRGPRHPDPSWARAGAWAKVQCAPGSIPGIADVAQLVEHHLAKVRVAGSSPVVRSEVPIGFPYGPRPWRSGRVA
jgi:hypothetical protein